MQYFLGILLFTSSLGLFNALILDINSLHSIVDNIGNLHHVAHQLPVLSTLFDNSQTESLPYLPDVNVDTKVMEAVAQQTLSKTTDLQSNFINYLETNPELKSSTSTYVGEFVNKNPVIKNLYDPFTEARAFLSDYVEGHPDLAKPTSKYLSQSLAPAVKSLERLVDTYLQNNPSVGEPTSQWLAKTGQNLAGWFKSGPGKQFEDYLDANPAYKQSTSVWVTEYTNKVVVPTATATASFLDKSPLFTDTRALFSKPTAEVVGVFSEKFNTASAPTLEPIKQSVSWLGDSIGKQLNSGFNNGLEGNPDLKLSTSEYFAKIFGGFSAGVDSDFGLVQDPDVIATRTTGSTSAAFSGIVGEGATAALQASQQASQQLAKSFVELNKAFEIIPPALQRASGEFGAQLSAKGEILAENTVGGLSATGDAISKVADDLANIGVPKVIEGTQKIVRPVAELDKDKVTAALNDVGKVLKPPTEVDPRIVAKFSSFKNDINSWKFFTDDNHMENGYWEKTFREGAQAARKLSVEVQETVRANSPK